MIKSFLQRRLRKRRREVLLETLESRRLLAAVSPPAFLQWFDSSFDTVEQRTPDVFQAGYGAVWLPPPGRADSGDQSVGYDAYDRFDLGSPDQPTLYGTETGLATVANAFDRAGVALHIDSVLNHAGFSDQGTLGFLDSGGYPGLAIKLADAIDGDFHSGFETGDLNGRLSGLVDIDHTTNHQLIRQPVDAAASNNIPAGDTADASGRLANVPTAKNARFYPDQDGDAIFLFDPVTNESNIPVYSFDADCSSCGDATAENATGYLMRYMQWMVQIVGVDGFRMDAAKHFEGFVMDYVDRAVYRSNPRTLLDGSTDHVFSYSEVFTGDKNTLLSFVKKNIDPADPGRIGGNRDALDFSAFFAMRDNLSSMGTSNAWQNVRDSLLDVHDDGLHNGSAGVLFVRSHDEFGPASLDNVAHAFALMHPGNAVVYMNGKEFGDARDFPKAGRGDALGGVYGDTISKLVAIRNTHGRGDMLERWIDHQGTYVFERDGSSLVGLSNRGDSGYDERTVQVNFAPGTHLIELTGNASDLAIDPNDDIQPVLTVSAAGTIALRIPRNLNANGEFHGKGYVIYGLPAPQAAAGLELTGVDSVLAGSVPSATDYENGRTRLSDLQVVTGDSLQVKLQTDEVNLLGLPSLRDVFADGDNALLRIDGGIDLNGNGAVDFVAPGLASYGFEQFGDKSSPRVGSSGLGGPAGDGEFLQNIDTTALSEGTHFLEVRAFRHRTDGGPAIFSDFKESIYVDRLPPDSGVLSFEPYTAGINENRDLIIQSLDKTADNVHVFLNLAAGITDTEVVQLVAGENQARKIDRDQFIFGYSSVPHGNNVATIVSYEPTGSVNVQRVPGLFTSTIVGAGLGDLDFDGDVDLNDTQQFEIVFFSNNAQFNPAADFNGDGQIDYADLDLFSISQADAGADQTILDAIEATRALKFGAVADSYSLNEDETFTQAAPGVLANDLDPGSGADFGISTLGSITSEQGVTVTLAADGSFDFSSAGVFGYLTSQQTQTDAFTYSVTDGLSHSSIATVTLTVQGINDAPTLAAIGNVTVNEDAVEQIIDLTGIGAGAGESQDLLVTATSDTPGLIPQPEVVYTSPNATGSLKYTPVANGSGTAEIVVTVADGGLDGNLATPGDNGTINRTVVIVVNPVNDVPTLDALDDLEIDEDAPLQTIQLAGIHAGPLETQTLRVTATSDNTNLIPDPTVTYTSANPTGSLSFTPVADQSGTATITVTVEDAGLDNDLATADDNATISRTVIVIGKAINDVPTLDALDDLEIDEDA
ncbi:MAG: Ig-like domain-containing protein, partial [Rubripirellula sp.]|nr:Ig-like domain-containing protein [Rubripirellula sp.]